MLNQAAVLRHVLTPREIKLALTAGWYRSGQRGDGQRDHRQISSIYYFSRVRFRSKRESVIWERIIILAKESAGEEIHYSVGSSAREVASRGHRYRPSPSLHSNFDTFRETDSRTEE